MAYLRGQDMDRARKVGSRIRAGQVVFNNARGDMHTPPGGFRLATGANGASNFLCKALIALSDRLRGLTSRRINAAPCRCARPARRAQRFATRLVESRTAIGTVLRSRMIPSHDMPRT